jgi:hypothetical protein
MRKGAEHGISLKSVLVAGFFALSLVAPAVAEEWTELPYNPPIGSRWIVESQSDETDNRPDGVRTNQVKSRGELTIEGKTAAGFHVLYVMRDIAIEGNAPSVPLMKPVLSILKDLVVDAEIDASGKPVKVDNIDEAKTTMRAFVDRTFKNFEGAPKLAAVLRPAFDGMLNVEGADAAKIYLQEVSRLAVGQNTGLKFGETRQESSVSPNPLGGPSIKMTATFKIAKVDAKTGAVTYVRDSQTDPEGMKDFALSMMQKLGLDGDKPMPPKVAAMIKEMKFSIDEHDEITVEGGMTRMLREEQSMSMSAMGYTLSKKTIDTLSLMPAP